MKFSDLFTKKYLIVIFLLVVSCAAFSYGSRYSVETFSEKAYGGDDGDDDFVTRSSKKYSGVTTRSSGTPARYSGTPARYSGTLARSSGTPARSSGTPARSSGTPVSKGARKKSSSY